ncbi:DDHD domain-containing protein [Sarocladium implicatum]|nr:DDHD domain-containing protein [Sarocladium implicatum]
MPPAKVEQKADKSYLTSAVQSLNPWGSRSATPTPGDQPEPPSPASAVAPSSDPRDHTIPQLYGQSSRSYPSDCPPLQVQWFHAVDVPKRKPRLVNNTRRRGQPEETKAKPPAAPKKFTAFSASDSKAIEARYQRLLEGTEDSKGTQKKANPDQAKVPVNEDFLFDVDILERELAPVYWLGPVYEVRRGTWFFQEGSTNRPCEENLAAQLEEGYLKMKPWLHPARARSQSTAGVATPKESQKAKAETTPTADASKFDKQDVPATQLQSASQPPSHRLFGMYMNSVVTYQDANTAWISSEGMLSWVTSSVYEKLGGGAYMGGIKLTRGFAESNKSREKDGKTDAAHVDESLGMDEKQKRMLKRRSAPPSTHTAPAVENSSTAASRESVEEGDNPHMRLHRQLSSLMESGSRDAAESEEQINRREEQVMQDDYNPQAGETQEREIDHLVLVTHGIGQLLGLRMESVNFVHDVNTMRKTLKSVYAGSADLKALNSESRSGPGNYPSLEDITVEGMAFARSLISDLALDVLLYQSSYREQISQIVLEESNRIYKLFKQRNPQFKGKVHLIGHSLGSAIYFDSLCRQREPQGSGVAKDPLRFWPSQDRPSESAKGREPAFDFEVADFYCLGSPVGLFQMLKGRTVAGRRSAQGAPSESPLNPEENEDPFSSPKSTERVSQISGLPFSVSSPKVEQLFNIFHPSDPISYRLEPLISPAMASLKPQQLPYTKKGIFDNVAPQSLTGIGAKVGQSVSDLWTNFSAGIASNLLNRSLGLSNEEVARLAATPASEYPPGAGTNISGGGVLQGSSLISDKTDERKKRLADTTKGSKKTDGKDPALIDDDIETLFSKFQSRHSTEKSAEEKDDEWIEEGRKARKMRVEEAKVRALNRNGRVDYSIQEGTLDFNPINTVASHLSYWGDEDVNHFVLSQLLSNKSHSGDKGI